MTKIVDRNSTPSTDTGVDGRAMGQVRVVHRGQEESYWQPKPANGFLSLCVAPHLVNMDSPCVVAVQNVPRGGVIREHAHDAHEEVLYVTKGSALAIVDGVDYRVEAGTTMFLGKNRKHKIINDSDDEFEIIAFMIPNGIESFFSQIGRTRSPGDQPPIPFDRPSNVAEIERRTVFAP